MLMPNQAGRVRQKLPLLMRNVRSSRVWRPRDMMNWHRMVAPLRSLEAMGSSLDFYHLIYDMCSTFEVDYTPCRSVTAAPSLAGGAGSSPSVALFVDAPDHTSGVATTISQWTQAAIMRGQTLNVFYSSPEQLFPSGCQFPPVGTLKMGVYQGLNLHMPVVADILKGIARNPPDAIHLSTPGPMGLIGLIAARQYGIPVFGTYHTDFPAYARNLTGDFELEQTAWLFMRWFYGQLERVATPSSTTRDDLIAHGFSPGRLSVVGRGIRTECFSPQYRDENLRRSWNPDIKRWLLYVGRLSREKNLACLAGAIRQIHGQRKDVGLVITGDGPYRAELESMTEGLPVVFTGIRKGEALSRIYASSDLFLFPSLTDTLGVVLLEAQASGVPVLVSSEGGPKDCLLPGITGQVVNPMNPTLLARYALEWLERLSPDMRNAARDYAQGMTPERSFEDFWGLHFREGRVRARDQRLEAREVAV